MRKFLPPLFSPGFQLVPPQSHPFSFLLRIVTELCIGPRTSWGGGWYTINLLPRIIKYKDWALNEGCCVEEYILLFPCLIWVMVVLLLGGQDIDSKMGAGWMGE